MLVQIVSSYRVSSVLIEIYYFVKILEINPLKQSQVKEIVALDQICLGGLWTAEGYTREIDSPNSSLLTLNIRDREYSQGYQSAKEADCSIIGIACLWSILEEAHITLLAVHPDYYRQGLGSLLLLALLQDAIARKLAWATLEVNVNNKKALNLYRKFGFEVVGTRKKYYQSTGDDASILWLKKLQHPSFKASLAQWQQDIKGALRSNQYYLHP